MATKKRTKRKKDQKKAIVSKRLRLSITKTQRIEGRFRMTIKESRKEYLSTELDKYKGIQVSYD